MKQRMVTLSLMGSLVVLLTGTVAQAALVDFSDTFDYSVGDLPSNAANWNSLQGGISVVTTPTGSISGPNVITNTTLGNVTSNVGRNIGQASDGGIYDFRLSVYTGSAIQTSNDILMRITNNTTLFDGSNKNIVFQAGIGDGVIKAFRGTPGGGAVDSEAVFNGVLTDNWYEIRALYSVDNGGSDSLVIDYRDVTGGGSFINLTSYTIINALNQGADNNYTITSRDFNGAGIAADGASVSSIPEPSSLALLALGGVIMLRRRR